MIKTFGHFAFALAMFFCLAQPSLAAEPENINISTEQLGSLIKTLESEEQRTQLVETLKALQSLQDSQEKEEPGLGARLMQQATDSLQSVGETISNAIIAFGSPSDIGERLRSQFEDKQKRTFWISLSIVGGLAIGSGIAVWLFVFALLKRARASIEGRSFDHVVERVFWLFVRTLLDVAPLLGFGLAAYGILGLVEPVPQQRLVILTLVNAIVVARSLIALARLAMTPMAPNLRVFPLSDHTAAYFFVWVKRFVNITVYGYFIVQVTQLLNVPLGIPVLIAQMTGLITLLMTLMLIAQNRRSLKEYRAEKAAREGGFQFVDRLIGSIADIWHIPAMLYAIIVYGVWAAGHEGGFWFLLKATIGTIVVLVVVRSLLQGIASLTNRMFRISPDLVHRFPGIEVRANRYQPVVRLVFSLLVGAIAVLAVLEVWGLNVTGALSSEYGRDMVGRIVRIILISGLSIGIIEITHLVIAHYLDSEDDDGNQVTRSARIKTLLPLARSIVVVVVGLVGALTIMSELGVDITPVLAGAGVLGLAVGFGAQTLVKDVITGVFILMEGAIAVGDVVKVAGHSGTVEALSVRSLRLRDLSGTVHTVPFSSVDSVENLTKDFSYYLLDVGVAYRENTDDVIEVLEAIDRDFQKDAAVRDDLLAPLEILGVNALGDSAVVIRARLKTRPGQQWRVGREFNRRMKLVFDDVGIEIPFPHQTIYFGENKDGTAPPLHLTRSKPDAEFEDTKDAKDISPNRSLDERIRALTKKGGLSSDAEPPAIDGEA